MTVLEENKLVLFTGFEDTTALEDKKSLTVFSALAVICCIRFFQLNADDALKCYYYFLEVIFASEKQCSEEL